MRAFRCVDVHALVRHFWLKSRLCVFISIHGHRHAQLFLSVLSFLVSLFFVLKSFFHLFLNPAMVPDENSMEDHLCNSSFGSMVSLDYVTPDTEFEWNIFPGFTTLQLCDKIGDLFSDLGQIPETFTGRILFMSITSPVTETTTKMNAWQMPKP